MRSAILQMERDPVINFNWGTPIQKECKSVDDTADEHKAEWMERLGMTTDEQWLVRFLSAIAHCCF